MARSRSPIIPAKTKPSPLNEATVQPLLIREVSAIAVSVPLTKPVLMGGGQRFDRSESLIVRIEAHNGLVGWGEASAAPSMTGENLAGMVYAVKHYLAPRLMGKNGLDLPYQILTMGQGLIGNQGAKAACDIALHDLVGQYLQVPVVQLLGGKARESVLTQYQLGNPNIEQDIAEARHSWKKGYRFFKLKVGVKSVEQEILAAHKIRKALGPDALLCADANMGLSSAHAHAYVQGVASCGLMFLEQPFGDEDIEKMAELGRSSPVDLCADESIHGINNIFECHKAGPIKGVNHKTIKLGGLIQTQRAAIISDGLGLCVDLASKTGESSIAAAALTHLAYAIPNLHWGLNINNHYLQTDLVDNPLQQVNASVACPTGPGLGVRVNEKLIRAFTIIPH